MDIPDQKTQYSGSKEPQKDWVLGKHSGKRATFRSWHSGKLSQVQVYNSRIPGN
jgi:hypothetical protein